MKFFIVARVALFSLIEDVLRPWSGPAGIYLRRAYYSRRLRSCGKRLTVGPGVQIVSPEWIELGNDVWIDHGCTLIAGPPKSNTEFADHENGDPSPGTIVIGNAAHIGIGSIIQGHGGVQIADAFTMAPNAKVYSYSNDYRNCRAGTVEHGSYRPAYLLTPVRIGSNVWVGLNAIVVGHRIGDDCFIRPASVVTCDVNENSMVSGDPAVMIGARFVNQQESSKGGK